MNKAALLIRITELILSGGNQTTADNVRTILSEYLDSYPNIADGGNVFSALVGYTSTLTITGNTAFTHKKYVDDAIANVNVPINPTSGFLPYNNNGSLDNSWYSQDSTGSILASGKSLRGYGGSAALSFDGGSGININKKLYIGASNINDGVLYFNNGSNSNQISLRSSATSASYDLKFPIAPYSAGQMMVVDGAGVFSWVTPTVGTVTAISVAPANGFAGSSSGGATPAIIISTSITGIIKGNGTSISAASSGDLTALLGYTPANKAGETFTGAVILNADAVTALGAVTLQQLQSFVTGLWDDRGNFTPSGSYPSSGGSGTSGAILKGDIWTVYGLGAGVAGTVGSKTVYDGDTIRALIDTPGSTDSNWARQEGALGYTPLSNVLNSAYVFVGDSTNKATARALSGAITISNTGVVTIANNYVTNAMLAGAIDNSKLVNSAITINGNAISLGGSVGSLAVTGTGLGQFASTSSSQLATVISDETGSGLLVFNNAPALINPTVTTQSANDNSTKAASTAYVDGAVAFPSIASKLILYYYQQ